MIEDPDVMTSLMFSYCGENHEDNKIFDEYCFLFNFGNGRKSNPVRIGKTFCNKGYKAIIVG